MDTIIPPLPVGTKVRLVKSGDIIEITPGEFRECKVARGALPRHGYISLMRLADGNYMQVLNSWGETVRLTEDLLRQLGIDISPDTLRRLMNGDFVRWTRPAPNTTLLDLASLHAHLEACRDPDFWTEERVRKYRDARAR